MVLLDIRIRLGRIQIHISIAGESKNDNNNYGFVRGIRELIQIPAVRKLSRVGFEYLYWRPGLGSSCHKIW